MRRGDSMYAYQNTKESRMKKSKAFSRFQVIQRCPRPVRRAQFTPEEDNILRNAVAQYGENNWGAVAALLPRHTPRRCRERWKFYLSPEQSFSWTAEMDARLLQLAGEYGNRYAKIAQNLGGVSDVSVKNRLAALAQKPRELRYSSGSISSIPRVDREIYFTEVSDRPSFTRETTASLYSNGQWDGSRMLYPCVTGPGSTAALPRRKDATDDEVHSGMFATIGHIKQWREYCASQCDPVITDDGKAQAYLRQDVAEAYNDVRNLELESQSYNSKIAYQYGWNPLAPEWV